MEFLTAERGQLYSGEKTVLRLAMRACLFSLPNALLVFTRSFTFNAVRIIVFIWLNIRLAEAILRLLLKINDAA